MAKIAFSPEARRDLAEIGDYIAFKLHNKAAARNLISRIQKTVIILQQFPESGTPLKLVGSSVPYRYLICGNYLIFYYLSGDNACVDRILYGRRDYLSILFGSELNDRENESN